MCHAQPTDSGVTRLLLLCLAVHAVTAYQMQIHHQRVSLLSVAAPVWLFSYNIHIIHIIFLVNEHGPDLQTILRFIVRFSELIVRSTYASDFQRDKTYLRNIVS